MNLDMKIYAQVAQVLAHILRNVMLKHQKLINEGILILLGTQSIQCSNSSIKQLFIFYISSQYNNPNWTTIQIILTIENLLKKFQTNIWETASKFYRWKDGTCIFCEESKGPNDEPFQKYAFLEDIIESPIITRVAFQIGQIKKKQLIKLKHLKICGKMIEENIYGQIFNTINMVQKQEQKNKMQIEKLVYKIPSTVFLERKMQQFKNLIDEFDEMPRERNAFFIYDKI